MKTVEELVGSLCAVLDELGLPPPLPAQGYIILERIDRMIAPARLPASLRRLWELIDLDRLGQSVVIYPQPGGPEGIEMWLQDEDLGAVAPRHFLNFAYTSHDAMWVECDGPQSSGGSLFESFISSGGGYELRYRSIEDWLETLITLLLQGAFEPWGGGGIQIDADRERELSAARLHLGSHPILGDTL